MIRSAVLACVLSIASAQAAEAPPYLPAAREPDARAILPPPPAPQSASRQADKAVFAKTRALQGSARWNLAAADNDLSPGALLRDFSCAAGTALDAARAPALARLIARVEADAEAVSRPAKRHFAIVRPQVGNTQPICIARSDALDCSPSYPSGHTTIGWAVASTLAEIWPDRATALLTRGRVFGESRIVCGVHWLSDVQAGRIAGAAVFAALQTDADFQSDLGQARAEAARLGGAPDPAFCQAQAQAAQAPLP